MSHNSNYQYRPPHMRAPNPFANPNNRSASGFSHPLPERPGPSPSQARLYPPSRGHADFPPEHIMQRNASTVAAAPDRHAPPPPQQHSMDYDVPMLSSNELNQLQRYFTYYDAKIEPSYEQIPLQRSVRGGGAQVAFVAKLEVPSPAGPNLHMQAEDKSKKGAKFALMAKVKMELDRSGWLAALPDSKKKRSRPAHKGPAATPSPVPPRVKSARDDKDDEVADSWESLAVNERQRGGRRDARGGAPARKNGAPQPTADPWDINGMRAPAPPKANSVVKDAWDDDGDLDEGLPNLQVTHSTRRSSSQARSSSMSRESPPPPTLSTLLHTAKSINWFGDNNAQSSSSGGRGYPEMPYPSSSNYRGPSPTGSSRPESILPRVDDVEKKFVAAYCKAVNVHEPNVKAYEDRPARKQRGSRGRGGSGHSGKTGWHAEMFIPHHTFNGQRVVDIHITVMDHSKKSAIQKTWVKAVRHLLNIVDPNFIEAFKEGLKSIKQRINEQLNEPLRINISESALMRLDTMLGRVQKEGAFEFQETHRPGNSVEDYLGLSSSSHTMPAHLRSRPLVHPDDIAIPRELENNKLPIFTRYQEIMAAIDNNAVTILAAETGAGKTTQIPQFILAHENLKRAKEGGTNTTNIVITQPRRIAAISVAQRVANERGEQVGRNSAIGYTVRFDDKRPTTDPANGHAIFCTSGILLKRLQQDPQLRNVSHIILDEVHERDLNTDLLLIIVRQLVKARPDLRVILMSATAETELFQSYFRGFGTVGPDRSPPIINVKGRMFPVEQHFLEDIEHLLQAPRALPARFNPSKESVHWYRNETGPMIAARGDDPVPYDYIEALIAHIATCRDEGAILVFLPGWQEIDTLQQRLREDERYRVGFANERMFRIFPLHSQVPTDKQQAVFEPAPPGVRKIILSTNIAETSVTINDVVYVIDLAKLRMNSYDADRRISSLNSVFASLSNLRQRSGRAGRVRPGMYFSLLSHKRKQRLPYSMPPELLRVDLQATVLKVKSLNLARRVADVFAAAPQSPNPGAVIRAVQDLQSLGALDSKEELTTIGQVLSNMPVDPWIGKMVLEAATLGCLDPILTIAGGMEIGRGIFAIHPDEKDKGRAHILTRYARDTESDHLTLLQAFRGWKKVHDNGRFADSKQYAFRNYLHHTSLQNIERSRQQLLKILEDAGFVSRQRRRDVGEEAGAAVARSSGLEGMVGDERSNALAHNFALVRAVICGALYPNVAEITGKDEYATATVSRLRLTTASVNSMRGLTIAASGATMENTGRGSPTGSTGSDVGDYDYIPEDGDETNSVAGGNGGANTTSTIVPAAPATPARLLAFQEKQQVDSQLYARNTTRVDPASLFLFASTAPADTTWRDGRPCLLFDNWLVMGVPSAHHVRVLVELRGALQRYIKWAVWRAQRRAEGRVAREEEERDLRWDVMGTALVREMAGLLEDLERVGKRVE